MYQDKQLIHEQVMLYIYLLFLYLLLYLYITNIIELMLIKTY